jgi:hypothetical protein
MDKTDILSMFRRCGVSAACSPFGWWAVNLTGGCEIVLLQPFLNFARPSESPPDEVIKRRSFDDF